MFNGLSVGLLLGFLSSVTMRLTVFELERIREGFRSVEKSLRRGLEGFKTISFIAKPPARNTDQRPGLSERLG